VILDSIVVKPPVERSKVLPIIHTLYVYNARMVVFHPILIISFCYKTIASAEPAGSILPYIVYAVFKFSLYYRIAKRILKFYTTV
jgi:hypothetical protein